MKKFILVLLILVTTLVVTSARQDHVLCNQNPTGPFTVTSGAPFNVSWIMMDTVTENGITVPNRYEGFYLQIDGGPKSDIGLAKALPACSVTSQKPGDIPYTYLTTQGVSRGTHTLKISAWNFILDGNGDPTTTKQESVVTQVPFSAGDPVLFGPPAQPGSVIISR